MEKLVHAVEKLEGTCGASRGWGRAGQKKKREKQKLAKQIKHGK
jgi:hypothetical protein